MLFVQTGTAPDVILYMRIERAFREHKVSFVYVKGITKISNTLWKWCAEYTQRNPWAFIFFFGSIITWLLPENIDRCVRETGAESQREMVRALDALKTKTVFYSALGDPVLHSELPFKTTRLNLDWEDGVRRAVAGGRWALLCGAPGIGKTYYLKGIFLPMLQRVGLSYLTNGDAYDVSSATASDARLYDRIHVSVIDGSNDRFTREALTDVLAREVGLAGRQTVLLVDEFHLMSTGSCQVGLRELPITHTNTC